MKTIIFIHGGESFVNEGEYLDWIVSTGVEWNQEPFMISDEKKKWRTEIAKKATESGNLVYIPSFPNAQNAKYSEWKLFFDAWIQKIQIEGELILIGNSLGGCFLLKYFSGGKIHDKLVRGINQIHLVAACITAGDFSEPKDYTSLQSLGDKVHIWHAEDDTVVPFSVGKEISHILPEAKTHFFGTEKGYGHFYGIENLPELEKILKITHL